MRKKIIQLRFDILTALLQETIHQENIITCVVCVIFIMIIMRELGITLEEVQENFGRSVKLRFSVGNIGDPMGAIRRVKRHLDETLSDEAIMRELGITLEEVQENFGRGVKLHFATSNISDPMGALRRVKKHLDETLSDEAIVKEL